jgi:hypothetical protein
VTVIRLIEVLQRILWIDLLKNFGRFTLRPGLAICKVLPPAGNFAIGGGMGGVCAHAHGYRAPDTDHGQTNQKRASGEVSVFNIGCFVLGSTLIRLLQN